MLRLNEKHIGGFLKAIITPHPSRKEQLFPLLRQVRACGDGERLCFCMCICESTSLVGLSETYGLLKMLSEPVNRNVS
jgi:hypothetical protein